MKHTVFYTILLFSLAISSGFAQESVEEKLCEDILRVKVQLDEQEALENMSMNAQIKQVGLQNNACIDNKMYNSVQNNLMIRQTGTDNFAQLEAYGNELNAGISQRGNLNSAELNLEGYKLDALVSQNGNQNSVQGNLQGINKQFYISQKDDRNLLQVNDISANGIPVVIIEMNGKMAIEWNNGAIKALPTK